MKINYTIKPLVAIQFGKIKAWVGKRVKHKTHGEVIILSIEGERIFVGMPDGSMPPCINPNKGYSPDSRNISDL